MRILAISPFLWTMGRGSGVPTLFRTLQEFGRHAEVHLLLPAHQARTEKRGTITLTTFRLGPWKWLGEFGPDRSIFALRFPGSRIGRYALDKLLWVHFVAAAFWHAWRLNRRIDADVFYGVTPYGAPVGFLLRLFGRGINVTRLLGTFLSPLAGLSRLRRWLWAIPHFTEVLAFYLPAAAVIITDDGTRGAEVARLLGARPVHCWRNGVDMPPVRILSKRQDYSAKIAAELGFPGAVLGLYVGQLVTWKRVDRLLLAVRDARASLQGRFGLLIVGDGPERTRLEELTRQCAVASMVRFLGPVSHDRLLCCHLAAGIFLCSHDLTCACNATFEAMAAGLPVIATDVGETAEIVRHGREGLLVDPRRPEQLREAIETLVKDPTRREEMGRKARHAATENLGTWRRRAARELELIHSKAHPRWDRMEGAVAKC